MIIYSLEGDSIFERKSGAAVAVSTRCCAAAAKSLLFRAVPISVKRVVIFEWSYFMGFKGRRKSSVLYLPGLSRDFDCFDFILEWDGMSGI